LTEAPGRVRARKKPEPLPLVIARMRGDVIDRELEVGSSAHYDDPAYYGSTYRARVADVSYYVDLAQKVGGPVLELGVGNGRIALPLARHGIDVVGIDASQPMLDDLRRRLVAEPPEVRSRITLIQGEMRKKRIRRRFPLVVCAFNTALHLYTRADFAQCFECVARHLAPGGRFVLDVSTPQPIDLARDPERWHGAPPFRHPAAGRVKYQERFEYESVRQVLFVTMRFMPQDGSPEWMTPLAHRQFFPAELEALVAHGGFRVEARHGDFEGGPLGPGSESQVLVCSVARSRPGAARRSTTARRPA